MDGLFLNTHAMFIYVKTHYTPTLSLAPHCASFTGRAASFHPAILSVSHTMHLDQRTTTSSLEDCRGGFSPTSSPVAYEFTPRQIQLHFYAEHTRYICIGS